MSPKPKDRPLLEAALQNIEVLVDMVAGNDAIAAVPVIGTAFKVCKGIDDIRSRVLATKLARFISEPALQSAQSQTRVREKVAASPEEAAEVGEALFLALDRFLELNKASVLARVFVAYVDGQVSAIDLRRIAHALDFAFGADIAGLLGASLLELQSTSPPWQRNLAPSGFTEARVRPVGPATTSFHVSPLGETLWKAYHHSDAAA